MRRTRTPANERQVVIALTKEGDALRFRAGCLGDTLLEASGQTPAALAKLNGETNQLRMPSIIISAAGRRQRRRPKRIRRAWGTPPPSRLIGLVLQTVGTVPPSMTYSVPVMLAARSDARKAIRLATSSGFAGRPIGIPPSESMIIFLPASMSPPCSDARRIATADIAEDKLTGRGNCRYCNGRPMTLRTTWFAERVTY